MLAAVIVQFILKFWWNSPLYVLFTGLLHTSLFEAEWYTDEQADIFKCEMDMQVILKAKFSFRNLISQTETQFFKNILAEHMGNYVIILQKCACIN